MKTYLLLLFVALLDASTGNCQPDAYRFKYLTVDEGLSHTDANDIAQDSKGFMWIGTYFGLDKYDGYSVKRYYDSTDPINNAFKNRIACIYPDASGNIWLATENGLESFNSRFEVYKSYRVVGGRARPHFQKLYKPSGNLIYGLSDNRIAVYKVDSNTIIEQKLSLSSDVRFFDMSADRNGALYLCSNQGLWVLDARLKPEKLVVDGLSNQVFSRLCFNNEGYLVLTSEKSIFLTDRRTQVLGVSLSATLNITQRVTLDDKGVIKDVVQRNASDYWVNIGPGLVRLDRHFNVLQSVTSSKYPHGLNSSTLAKIFIDRSECLWVCTFGGGVNYCDLNQKLFNTLQHNPESANSLSGNHIRSVLEDAQDLWVGTMTGLNHYDLSTQRFTAYNSFNSPVKLKSDEITSLTFDDKKNLWIGSSSGIEILQKDGKQLLKPSGWKEFPRFAIETLVRDCYGNIWFGNHVNSFGVIWKDAQNSYHVRYYGEGYFILADSSRPELFVSSTQGLKRFVINDKGEILKTTQYQAASNSNSLSSNYTYPIRKQNDSTYWIGTIGGGLNRLSLRPNDDQYSFRRYGADYGVFNDVESLEIDDSGNIWMGGNGLECFNPVTEKVSRYDKNDGLQGNSFKVGASCKGRDGRLYFGGINGLNYFYPGQVKFNQIPARPILTNILINNQEHADINTDVSTGLNTRDISDCHKITLSYLDNNFVIYFSSMHFANPFKCRYRYRLVGFDKNWKYTDGSNPGAAYNNLDYKTYQFVLQASNNDGIWSQGSAEASISITPPWWISNPVKTIYVLLVISILLGIYFYQARWYRLKREMEVRAVTEKKREEIHRHREELYQQQLTFFTNVSHEFRTPLTLILGPLENLMRQNQNKSIDYSYQLIFRNARRLTNLISELMNFRKVADSAIKLKAEPVRIHQFCEGLISEFEALALSKNISLRFEDRTRRQEGGWLDIQVVEKILLNLVNNSFKYTNNGGQISLEVLSDLKTFKPSFNSGFELPCENYRGKRYIYFRVVDTGVGISSDSITKIFDRYYRVSKNHLGSGVGLALVKSLVALHKGDIYVYSERHKGTEFIIGLPWAEEDYSAEEKLPVENDADTRLEPLDNSTLLPLSQDEQVKVSEGQKFRKRILIVDDNRELLAFLKNVLESSYDIYEAQDGHSALRFAIEKAPDLIISDVMMTGGMSGLELCKAIKLQFETSHIPFIILSAKSTLDTKIEGMELGADLYFEKPLSVELLLLSVHNIFEQSERLKRRYTNNYLSEATELVHSEKDREFLKELTKVIEENMSDTSLDVDFLCRHLHISRTKLYQKIKSVSDQSVAELVRTVRLKKAVYFMTHHDISMGEVVDRIGMQSSSNFSRAFKKEFGKSPLQFLQSLKNERH